MVALWLACKPIAVTPMVALWLAYKPIASSSTKNNVLNQGLKVLVLTSKAANRVGVTLKLGMVVW